MEKKIFYIYVDKTADDGTIFYVGKGQKNRILYGSRNQYWQNITNKYGKIREIILGTMDETFAFQEEIRLIKEHRTFEADWDDGSGWGANFTTGGDGASGRVVSEETKKLMSEKLTGQKRKPPSIETRKKIGDAHRGEKNWNWMGINITDETKQKMSNSKIGEKNNRTNLTELQVIEIRNKYFTGKYSYKQLGDEYGLSKDGAMHIITLKNWSHLPTSQEYKNFLQSSLDAQKNGTQSEATIQKIIANTPRGENHPWAQLTNIQVNEIRNKYTTGRYTHRSLAKEYNLTKSIITSVLMNKTWTHIEPSNEWCALIDQKKNEIPKIKIDIVTAREIKEKWNTDNYSCKDLIKEFGYSRAIIEGIVYGRTWKNV